MSTYRRNGHWRRGKNGQLHWVSAHSVTRTSSSGWPWRATPVRPTRRERTPTFLPPVRWRRVPTEPNATCPVCGARVWFFRNERGGCAYFDAIGAPWPKHSCMDSPGRHDQDAARQAMQAFERAQAKAAERAQRTALAEERRRQRVATRTSRAARQGPTPETTSSLAVSSSGDVPETSERKRWALGWWTAFAMLLAWLGSLPFTVAVYGDLGDSGLWAMHLLVGMPTVVSLLALLWFLFTVPTPRPTVRRVCGALLLAPLFLLVGMLVFLFTVGLGSLGFAWFLWWQGRSPSASTGEW